MGSKVQLGYFDFDAIYLSDSVIRKTMVRWEHVNRAVIVIRARFLGAILGIQSIF
jgi:hypothetical protein